MIDRNHDLSLTRQAQLLDLSRGSLYYVPVGPSKADLELMREIDRIHTDFPHMGARQLRDQLRRRPPESLHENIVSPGAPPIHAEPSAEFFGYERDEVAAGELAALIGIEDLRFSVAFSGFAYRLFERRQARTRRVAQSRTAKRYRKPRAIGI